MTISTRPGRRSATRNWRMSGCDRPRSTANGTTPFDPAQRPTEVVKVIRGRPLSPIAVNLAALRIIPGAVGTIAFGKYLSPDYLVHPDQFIPPIGTSTGTP